MPLSRPEIFAHLKNILGAMTGKDPADVQRGTRLIEDLKFSGARALRALASRLEGEFAALGIAVEIDRTRIVRLSTVWDLAGLVTRSQVAPSPQTRGAHVGTRPVPGWKSGRGRSGVRGAGTTAGRTKSPRRARSKTGHRSSRLSRRARR